MLIKKFFLDCWIRLLEYFIPFCSDTYCMRNADFVETDVEGIDDESVESLLNPSPDNSCEDLSQCCLYFPIIAHFFVLSNFMKRY